MSSSFRLEKQTTTSFLFGGVSILYPNPFSFVNQNTSSLSPLSTSVPVETIAMLLGDHNLYTLTPSQKFFRVEAVYVHPDFNVPSPLNNDIALAKLPQSIAFSREDIIIISVVFCIIIHYSSYYFNSYSYPYS